MALSVKDEPKTHEHCGKPVEVQFYADVPCNRFKGHEGDCSPAPVADEPAAEVEETV